MGDTGIKYSTRSRTFVYYPDPTRFSLVRDADIEGEKFSTDEKAHKAEAWVVRETFIMGTRILCINDGCG